MQTIQATACILPFESEEASLPVVGGKGANLARLARAGFPVPPGFLVTTRAYQAFVEANEINARIAALLPNPIPQGGDADRLEQLSDEIRGLFSQAALPENLASELRQAYAALGEPAVAVRSSATAEDLPDMSFAGQQDTYLNVVGGEMLLARVIDCWSSLWTARALGYRARNGVPQDGVALAVVVQRMVESQASGVMFTANPLSGLRSETVIDATLGLGEALVSGQVEPDHYVVETSSGQISAKTLGEKALVIHGQAGGGTVTRAEDARERQALPDEAIRELAELGRRVAAEYNFPQDIEWGWVDGQLFLLQSRPVTSLFPLPEGIAEEPLKVLFSFGAVQGLLDPITPLGRDVLQTVFAEAGGIFGMHLTSETQTALLPAGERLWINLSSPARSSIGRAIIPPALDRVEPGSSQAIQAVWNDPRLQPGKKGISLHGAIQLARFALPLAANVWLNLFAPDPQREAIVGRGERLLKAFRAETAALQGDRRARLVTLVGVVRALMAKNLDQAIIPFISGVAAGIAALTMLNNLSKDNDRALMVARGVPHNPTTDMDLALWQVARQVKKDAASRRVFDESSPAELAVSYRAEALPPAAQQAFAGFLERYGERGLGEIDAGRPRWRDDPTPIFDMVCGYLRIENPAQAPDAVYKRGAQGAAEAIEQMIAAARRVRGGWLKARLVRLAAGRARALLGMRESPKFFVVRFLGIFRGHLMDIGEEFVRAGELEQADDLVYLTLGELIEFAADETGQVEWRERIHTRREANRREMLRRQIPRILLSDGRAFYTGITSPGEDGETLAGSPVSPGSVEGRVRVVFDPRQSGLQPGEILVCRGTDPSWTPLFLTAAGLVMEVGGMMTHGAVVAREYGIPAVVGVDQVTQRLQDGQLIRVDGSSGEITLIE